MEKNVYGNRCRQQPCYGNDYHGFYFAISWTGVLLFTKFFFQLVFCATAATIVLDAVGGRIKFLAFIIFSFLLTSILYPVTEHWIWGGDLLAQRGFWDFACSTVVHSVGIWAAFAGSLVLGLELASTIPMAVLILYQVIVFHLQR